MRRFSFEIRRDNFSAIRSASVLFLFLTEVLKGAKGEDGGRGRNSIPITLVGTTFQSFSLQVSVRGVKG